MGDMNENNGQRGGLINRILAGRYETLETLGEGPLLAAYRARDRAQNRIVTLKALLPAYADSQEIRDALRAGLSQTLSLTHPNITRTFDVGQDDDTGLLFLAEEFVRGIDLKERIRRAAPFQLTAATETAIAIGEALEFAHARGVAHGDVRPQNVRVSPEGQTKLTNFGFAAAQNKALRENPDQRRRVADYLAPESTQSAAPSPSADIYALGAILFEMLTGEVPYRGEDAAEIALKHTNDPTPSPRTINAAVPTALDGVTRKALGKTPETRYASATEMLRDLRTVRDALRFGKSLSWSPLTEAEMNPPRSAPVPPPPAPAVASPAIPAAIAVASTASVVVPSRPTPVSVNAPETPVPMASSASVAPASLPEALRRTRPREEKNQSVTPDNPVRSGGSRALAAVVWTAALGFVCALCFLTYIIFQFLKPTSDVVVPNLVGKKLTDAQQIAQQNKFNLAIVDQQYRDEEAEGVVYQMGTTPGRHIKEGRDVQVWVSKGPRLVEIPDLGGMDFEKARKKLENVGLRLGDYKGEYDFASARGTVIRQKPASGESAARGTRIDLTISKGEEPTPTPEPIPTPDTSYTPDPAVSPEAPVAAPPAGDGKLRTFDITYPPNNPLPADGAPHRIRIDVVDDKGASTVFDEVKNAGERVKYRVEATGNRVSIKLYDNDELRAEVNK